MFPVFADLVLLPAVIVGLVRVPLAPQNGKSQVATDLGLSLFVQVVAHFRLIHSGQMVKSLGLLLARDWSSYGDKTTRSR